MPVRRQPIHPPPASPGLYHSPAVARRRQGLRRAARLSAVEVAPGRPRRGPAAANQHCRVARQGYADRSSVVIRSIPIVILELGQAWPEDTRGWPAQARRLGKICVASTSYVIRDAPRLCRDAPHKKRRISADANVKTLPRRKPGPTLPASGRRIGGSRLAPGKRFAGGCINGGSAGPSRWETHHDVAL